MTPREKAPSSRRSAGISGAVTAPARPPDRNTGIEDVHRANRTATFPAAQRFPSPRRCP